MIDNFDDAVEVVRVHSFYGNLGEEVMEAVQAIRMYWDQEKVDRINLAIAPMDVRPVDGEQLYVLYRINPVLQWQVISKTYIPEVLMDEEGNLV